MKKLSLLLVLILLMPLLASARTLIDGIYYEFISETEAEVVHGDTEYSGIIDIPATVTYDGVTYSVTSIGNYTFSKNSQITSITIPNSVRMIDGGAFYGCSGLTSIIIPNSVTSIGENAFYYCTGLTSVTIPNSVVSIGSSAFSGCSGLTSVTIGSSVTYIGSNAFQDCKNITTITIPNSVISIGSSAFSGTAWEDNQPDGLIYAGKVAYRYKGITPDITSISIEEGTKGISTYAFSMCKNLTSITIPNSVISIGSYAFYNTAWEDSQPDGLIYAGKVAYRYKGKMADNTAIYIKEGTLGIACSAFAGCTGMTSVTIPNSVTLIGDEAFSSCSGLTSVDIPNSVTSIGGTVFFNCKNLTSVNFGNNVTSVGGRIIQNCSSLADVYCYTQKVPVTYRNTFYSSNIANVTLHVPATALDAYKTTAPWSGFGTIISIDGGEPVVEGIAINEENFPDESFRNWILSQSYGSDSILTEEEIVGVKSIKVSINSIKSLKGIEYFTALEELDCNKTQLDTLDVSHNTALTTLRCYANKLTSLDLSKNTALEYLHCYNNQLTLLDVSGCPALKYLYCYNNQLTSLNLSKNSALERLNSLNNRLTSIDVSGCMSLQLLYCYQNQIYGKEMDAFIASLPTVSNNALYVMYHMNEGNVMTTTQVAAAKAKGWTPYYYDGITMQEYAGSEPLKCATPTIIYFNGKLIFYCATEGVKYNYSIESSVEGSDSNVTLPTSCKISVYATKEGYEPSDPFTQEISMSNLIGKLGDVNKDGKITMQDAMFIVNYILNGKFPNQ